MDCRIINRISGISPVVLSVLAFAIVMSHGPDRGGADEGPAAHMFQLSIIAELPFVLIFLATADPTRVLRVAGTIAFHACALALPFAAVAIFKL